MGGHAAGEVASQESVEAVFAMVARGKPELQSVAAADATRAAYRLLEGAVQFATYVVYGIAEQDHTKTGMGTTLSAMMSFGEQLIVAQVGDSRIYCARAGKLFRLTEDHTLVAWQLKEGMITEAQARSGRQRNVITRAVGSHEYVQVDVSVWAAQRGDRYLLCSDGLHGYLPDEELVSALLGPADQVVSDLIGTANARGGRDNITALVVDTA